MAAIQTEKSAVTWTTEQQKVIDLRHRSLLVSAAAGSGKTAVLVERIISMITDPKDPMDVDELLVVTFTNAAAAEMRERVLNAIEKAADADPLNAHLQRQMALIHNAQITTIDSFCKKVVQNHFHCIDMEPGFRIADKGELTLLQEDVCAQVLEQFYEEKDEAFLHFIDSYANAKNDKNIQEMIFELYKFSQSYPWPEEWLDACAGQYEAQQLKDLEEKPWVAQFLKYLHVRVKELCESHRLAYDCAMQPDGSARYAAVVNDDIRQLEGLLTCKTLEEWQEKLADLQFKNSPTVLKAEKGVFSEQKKTYIADARKEMRAKIKQFKEKYFSYDLPMQLQLLEQAHGAIVMLVQLTKAFSNAFAAQKAAKNIVDFSDLEHMALRILVDSKTKQPTQIAAEYRKKFREVMIDEYQDSNYVQEALLTAVSGISEGVENLFMVGDVKQSIYRFRLARPELFMGKYHAFSTEDNKKQRIDLHKNFRSRKEVIDVVNDIFARIMGQDLGNVDYDTDASLYLGRDFEPYENPLCNQTECILIPEDSTEEAKLTEARIVAQRVRSMIENEEIPGKTYKDVTILLRSLTGWAETFQTAFEEIGVPLVVPSQSGYFKAQEVQIAMSMLRIIDNPRQDIPLAAVLRSAIGGLSAEELAYIKLYDEKKPFYACVAKLSSGEDWEKSEKQIAMEELLPDLAAQITEKLQRFFAMLTEFRKRSAYTPIHALLQQIYDKTSYYDYVTALPAGAKRRANLDMLLEKAISYEATSYHGLYHFIRYIDRLVKYDIDYGEAETIAEQETAVRLMSIHKSKGLEFPIVVLAGMGKQFNTKDETSSMVFHSEFGVGIKLLDAKTRKKKDTLIRQILSLEIKKESLGEELRILYVALTRAKEKLVLVGKKPKKEWYAAEDMKPYEKLSFSIRMDAKCYWDWVLPALVSYEYAYSFQEVSLADSFAAEQTHRFSVWQKKELLKKLLADVDADLFKQVKEQLDWTYPYEQSGSIKQKVSVSELKHRAMEEARELLEETAEEALFRPDIPVPYVPRFEKEQEANEGALRGTAMHRFLESIDHAAVPVFKNWQDAKEWLTKTTGQLCEMGRMKEEEVARLYLYGLYRFFASPTARRMAQAAKRGLLFREQPFVMSVDANRVWQEAKEGETVLIQGIIDVFWEEEDGLVLLDYKTDRVKTAGELKNRYAEQLRLYKEALERHVASKNGRVKEVLLYSFALEETIPLE